MWALVGLGSIELLVVHLFVSLKWPWLAWPLSVLSALSIFWVVTLIRSFKARPHLLDSSVLQFNLGRLRAMEVPVAAIASIRGVKDGAEVKAAETANLCLISYPNRIVDLVHPIAFGRKTVRKIALALDDPAAFDLALQR